MTAAISSAELSGSVTFFGMTLTVRIFGAACGVGSGADGANVAGDSASKLIMV